MSVAVESAALPPRRAKPFKDWLSRKQAATYLESIGCPVSVRMLEIKAQNNNEGDGPPFTRIGWKTVQYRRADLDAWAKRVTVRVE